MMMMMMDYKKIVCFFISMSFVLHVGFSGRLLGSSCKNDGDCQRDIESSYCRQGKCLCQPFYAQYNNSVCLQSTLLGYDCILEEQCYMKVANSSCLEGACRCVDGFLQFRKHTCLGPARPGDVCYSNAHCRLHADNTHCEFLIPNLFGRCQCNSPLKQLGEECIGASAFTAVPLSAMIPSDPSTQVTKPSPNSIPELPRPTLPLLTELMKTEIPPKNESLPPDESNQDPMPTNSTDLEYTNSTTIFEITSTDYTNDSSTTSTISDVLIIVRPSQVAPIEVDQSEYNQTDYNQTEAGTIISEENESIEIVAIDELTTKAAIAMSQRTTSMEPHSSPIVMSSSTEGYADPFSMTTELFVAQEAITSTSTKAPVRTRIEHTSAAVSLGLPCVSDIECRASDPASFCNEGRCDCVLINATTTTCSADNRGCHPGTFQCRATGACISWYFVCDGRPDCADGSDEECDERRCPAEAFRCASSGKCVSKAGRCDGRRDCPDDEDEKDCAPTSVPVTRSTPFLQRLRHPIIQMPRPAKRSTDCPAHTFRCVSDGRCLPEHEFCNAIISCPDGSDEPARACRGGLQHHRHPVAGFCPFRCANGRCRSSAIACSGRDGCGDASDEANCRVCRCPAFTSQQRN